MFCAHSSVFPLQNLDNWKSSRRKQVEHIIERCVEVKRLELEEHDRSRRRSKTFSEMMEDRYVTEADLSHTKNATTRERKITEMFVYPCISNFRFVFKKKSYCPLFVSGISCTEQCTHSSPFHFSSVRFRLRLKTFTLTAVKFAAMALFEFSSASRRIRIDFH